MRKRWINLLLDPQAGELGSGGGGSQVDDNPISSDDAGTNDPSVTDDSGGTDDPSVTEMTETPTPTPAQSQWQSIRDVARARGYNVGQEFGDDAAFLDHLLSQAHQARQSDFHARLGQQLAPHAARIQQFLGQQVTPQEAEAKAPKPWEAPEFDERWMAMVNRDATTGLYVAKPGADPQWAQKVNAFAEWKKKYDSNPAAVLNAMVEERAKKIADEHFNARFAEREREQTVRSIVAENSQWLYQRDEAGARVITDYRGQPMLTPAGAMYMRHLATVKQMGVTDPRHQDALAKQMTQAEHYAAQAQSAAAKQGQQNPQTRAATNNPPINPIQAAPPSQRRVHPHDTPEKNSGKSLSDMIRESLAAEGVTDQDIASSIG